MIIKLTKISRTQHSFEYVRDDKSGEKLELDTKTFLFHDLLHFAVEMEAGLGNSFYGMLASGKKYAELAPDKETKAYPVFVGEVAVTERVVGPLSGVVKGDVMQADFMAGIKNIFEAYNERIPFWLTDDFVTRVRDKMRQLLGEWNSLPVGKTMELKFDLL